jgi:hypothetical protein
MMCLKHVGGLDKCGKVVDSVSIVPLPTQDNLLIGLDIT